MPDLYTRYYSSKFTRIPLDEVFGSRYSKAKRISLHLEHLSSHLNRESRYTFESKLTTAAKDEMSFKDSEEERMNKSKHYLK